MKMTLIKDIILCLCSLIVFNLSSIRCDDVVVVGAGMAGCSAARILLRNTEHNVIVLEADPDRYGGRMWTTYDVLSNGTGG